MKKEGGRDSSKIIVVLLVAAIVLSVASLALTLSSANSQPVKPQPNIKYVGVGEDEQGGKIGLVITPPANVSP